jgi:hypothetical protein
MSPNVVLFIMPAFDPNEKAALLSRAAEGVRRIYCTDITSCDVLPLLGGEEKLSGTVIDAILKKYQRSQGAPLFNVQRRSSSSTSLASKYVFQEGKCRRRRQRSSLPQVISLPGY